MSVFVANSRKLSLFSSSSCGSPRNAAASAIRIEQKKRLRRALPVRLAQHAHERRDADAARDEYRGPRRMGERELADRTDELHARTVGQRSQRALECRVPHPGRYGERALERSADERESAAGLPLARRRIEQLEHDGLSCLEVESRWFLEAKSEGALGELLAA